MRVWLSRRRNWPRAASRYRTSRVAIQSRNVEVPGRPDRIAAAASSRSAPSASSRPRRSSTRLVVRSANGQTGQAQRSRPGWSSGAEDERSTLRFNGIQAVAIGVVRQSKANLIQVADGDPAGAPDDPGRAAARREDGHRRSTDRCSSRRSIQRGPGDPAARGRAGGDDHLRVSPEPPGDHHPRPRDPDLDHRDLRGDVLPRILGQQPDPAGADTGHRHRGGRRDHRAGERLPAPGGAGRIAGGGGHQRHPGDRLRGDRDHDLAGGGVHPARVPEGQYRTAVQRVRYRRGRDRC